MINKSLLLDEYIENVCYCVAVICLYQPFFDGNTRVCLILQKLLLEAKGIKIKSLENESLNNKLIPIFYSEEDSVPETTLIKVKK